MSLDVSVSVRTQATYAIGIIHPIMKTTIGVKMTCTFTERPSALGRSTKTRQRNRARFLRRRDLRHASRARQSMDSIAHDPQRSLRQVERLHRSPPTGRIWQIRLRRSERRDGGRTFTSQYGQIHEKDERGQFGGYLK